MRNDNTNGHHARLTAGAARGRLRDLLAGSRCVRPASVFDPMSMRMAADLGFEIAMLGGSVAALAVLGTPDHTLLTLTEFAGLGRRLCRTGALPLLVDADHGFGNALNAMRCVEELETSGVAGMTIEDSELPAPYGAPGGRIVGIDEAAAKIAAAVAARSDTDFAVVARTTVGAEQAASGKPIDDLRERASAFAAAGAQAIFLARARHIQEVETVAKASGLPIILAAAKGELESVDLASLGVRICLRGHDTIARAASGAWQSLADAAGRDEGPPGGLIARFSEEERYDRLISAYLKPSSV
ncbi:MAG: isocitrate lyase/phosphoenolpyruvate mutase family protein [Phyllobacterium sp.]